MRDPLQSGLPEEEASSPLPHLSETADSAAVAAHLIERTQAKKFIPPKPHTREGRAVVEETQRILSDSRVLESMVEGVVMTNENHLIVFTNPAFDAMFGYERGELIGQQVSVLNAAAAEEQEQWLTEMSEWARTQAGWRGEINNRKKDGALFTTYARVSGMDVAGQQHFVSVQEDLSERKRLTEALQEKERQFEAIFEEAAIGIALSTMDGRIAVSNPALQVMLGYSRDELRDMLFLRLMHPDDRQTAKALYRELVHEKRTNVQMEGRYTHKDNSLRWTRLITSLVRDPKNGEPLFMVSTVEDVTQHKQAEEKLRESARLATMGATAAKLAHEIGNPLNGMYTTIQLLERHLAKHKGTQDTGDDILTSTMQDLTHEIHRLRALLQEFLALARPQQLAVQPIDLAVVVKEVLAIEAPQYHEQGIGIEQVFPQDLPPVMADREKLKQVLLNLCKNAVEAMPKGGTLTVRGSSSEGYVDLAVIDTGEGIPQGMDIFELFTTTKPGGTGLGLAIVRQIIAAHRGTITYSSVPGQGATFRVTLPLSAAEL
ncbi:MAG: PAS domain S-box protein [Candidatus Binatia bacterium]